MAYALVEWFYDVLRALGVLATKEARIVFVGLDNAGKTTLLHMLKHGRVTTARPTMHPTNETMTLGSLSVQAYDLGGHRSARRLWTEYCRSIDAIVFLCDAADRERFDEARRELHALLRDDGDDADRVPVLVLGNKIDCRDAASSHELIDALGLAEPVAKTHRPLELFMCSITERRGYREGLDWLASHL